LQSYLENPSADIDHAVLSQGECIVREVKEGNTLLIKLFELFDKVFRRMESDLASQKRGEPQNVQLEGQPREETT